MAVARFQWNRLEFTSNLFKSKLYRRSIRGNHEKNDNVLDDKDQNQFTFQTNTFAEGEKNEMNF